MKVRPESTTQNISFITEFAMEFNYYKMVLKIRQVLKRSYLQQFIRVHHCSGRMKIANDIMM